MARARLLIAAGVILAVSAIIGCKPPWGDVSDTYDPQFPEIRPIGAMAPEHIGQWLNFSIQYVDDDIHDTYEYWQSPDQTYTWRAGDCEDFAILMMYMTRAELGGWPQLVKGMLSGGGHAWIEWEGRWYEPLTGENITNDPNYVLVSTISYGVALWRSMNTHKVISN